MLVEQAIFTSTQSSSGAGYQLVAASAGVADVDARELSTWGPSHDSLWEIGPAAVSVNFHPLPSGAYCISQTMPAGAEYSLRRGPNVYTQSLVVSPQGLAQFGNNPFALLQAAVALGQVAVLEKIPKRLDPFLLESAARWVDKNWLAQLIRHPGPVWLGTLLQTALATPAIGIVAGERGASLAAALIHCLPMECRTEFSFSTGLRFSPRRPFRVICLPNHSAENRRLERQQFLTLLETKSPPVEPQHLGGWAGFVAAMITSGHIDYLAAALAQPRQGLTLDQIDALGNELIHGFNPWRAAQSQAAERPAAVEAPPEKSEPAAATPSRPGSPDTAGAADSWQRADGSHGRVQLVAAGLMAESLPGAQTNLAAAFDIEEEPARTMSQHCPTAVSELREMEDAIFEAIAGKPRAVAELKGRWLRVLVQIGPSRAEAAREEYLRYALSVWRQINLNNDVGDPQRAFNAMEVISLLFDP